jgi:hypothetical protein
MAYHSNNNLFKFEDLSKLCSYKQLKDLMNSSILVVENEVYVSKDPNLTVDSLPSPKFSTRTIGFQRYIFKTVLKSNNPSFFYSKSFCFRTFNHEKMS